jgi:hypothetical protein
MTGSVAGQLFERGNGVENQGDETGDLPPGEYATARQGVAP